MNADISRNDFVDALTLSLDFLELGNRNTVTNHNKRVAYIALRIAYALSFSQDDMFDLYAYAVLHDNGIAHSSYQTDLADCSKVGAHCLRGEENLKHFPFLVKRENILKYHHENFDGSGHFGLKGDEIPLFSQITHMADMTEVMYNRGESRALIISATKEQSGAAFTPELAEVVLTLLRNESFWLSLNDLFISKELRLYMPDREMILDWDGVTEISRVMSKIIDMKSPFTARHSKGLAEKAATMADFYKWDEIKKTKFIIAALLHDTGKLIISNDILDKDGKLTAEEYGAIKSHTFYTRRVLEAVRGFEEITEWAANHHERLSGGGYPYGFDESRLGFEDRLMACLDIYQALTEERPYRHPMEKEGVARILYDMADTRAIDKDIAKEVLETL
ncbi:HD family phosphohydrolase [Clostridia bacterium]|nr:HD family phosphohydrolase [Clostridia bacterium]